MILVTGAGGYLGSGLVNRLLEEGHRVRAMESADVGLAVLDDFSSDSLEVFDGDVTSQEDVEAAVDGGDAVFHMAGISSVEACREQPRLALEVNGYAARSLLEYASDLELFVYPSSVAGMYTKPSRGRITEDDAVVPVNDYGVSKFLGETYARAYRELHGSPTLVFRQSNVYGVSPAGAGRGVARIFMEQALNGDPITVHGSGEQSRDLLHVDDLLDAYIAALRSKPVGEMVNLASGTSVSISELAERVAELVPGTEIIHQPSDRDELEIKRYEVSNERAENVLDWRPEKSLGDGLRELKGYLEERI